MLLESGFFGGEASFRVPGPNPYWIQGFAKISEDDINKFKEEYDWTLVEEGKKPDLETEILNLDEEDFEWYYSEEFNKYVKPAKYSGVFISILRITLFIFMYVYNDIHITLISCYKNCVMCICQSKCKTRCF